MDVAGGAPGHAGLFGGNASDAGGGGGAGLGGAIFNDGGVVTVVNKDVYAELWKPRRRRECGVERSFGGAAIFSLHGSLTVLNSTVTGNGGTLPGISVFHPAAFSERWPASNSILAPEFDRQQATIHSPASSLERHRLVGSGNLVQGVRADSCPGAIRADPRLGPLQMNGGLTPTMSLTDSSPAFDAGDVLAAELTDQRGAFRPQGDGFDIGGYEVCVFDPKESASDSTRFCSRDISTRRHFRLSAVRCRPPSGDYTLNSVQPLTATPNAGFSFVNWSGNVVDPESASTFVVMDEDQTVTANFAGCVVNVSARATAGKTMSPPRVDLTWAPNGAAYADVFRGATSGGPYASSARRRRRRSRIRRRGSSTTRRRTTPRFFASAGVKMCDSSEVARHDTQGPMTLGPSYCAGTIPTRRRASAAIVSAAASRPPPWRSH